MKFLPSVVQKLSSEQTHRQTDRWTDTQIDRHTDRHTDTQTDRQTRLKLLPTTYADGKNYCRIIIQIVLWKQKLKYFTLSGRLEDNLIPWSNN